MKVTLDSKELKNILDLSAKFVAKNNTLPILQNIYIYWKDKLVTFRATDMEKYIEIHLEANVEGEWALTIDAKTFSDIIRNNEDEYIDLSINQEKDLLTVKWIYDNFSIKWINASEYVALPEMNSTQTIEIPSQTLSQWIEKTEFAVTEKNFSPIFTWILIKTKITTEWNKLIFVWTDSFRLAEYKVPYTGNIEEEMSIIIPKSSINDIQSIAQFAQSQDNDNKCSIELSKNLLRCNFEISTMKIQATTLLIQWNFPDYDNEKIMPREFSTTMQINKVDCEKSIKKIWILTKDINNYILLDVKWNDITIQSWDTDKWDWKTQLQWETNGPDLQLWLNWRHVTDFIRAIEGDELIFNMINNQSPLILSNKNDENYRYVIRPIQK